MKTHNKVLISLGLMYLVGYIDGKLGNDLVIGLAIIIGAIVWMWDDSSHKTRKV